MNGTKTENGSVAIRAYIADVRGKSQDCYCVCYPEDFISSIGTQSITFSINSWKGKNDPQKGQSVDLSQVEKFRRGWRASLAQPISLEQQQQD